MSTPNAPENPAAKTQRLLEEIAANGAAVLAELRTLNHRLSLGDEGGVSSVELEEDSKGKVKAKPKVYLGPGITSVDMAYEKAAAIVARTRKEFPGA